MTETVRPDRAAPARVTAARRIAWEVIHAVTESDSYANLLLPVKLERAKLTAQDAALATELTYGTLRGLGYYDAVIRLAAGRETARIDPPVLDVLRLGAHQLLATRVAPHAAVDESVTLTRVIGARSASGFVNGVLRTLTRSTPDEWRERVLAGISGDQRLALEHSHPAWVVAALRDALAADERESELVALLEADNAAPRVSLVALPGLATVEELTDAEPSLFSPVGAVSAGGDPAHSPVVRSGRARVQDVGSQLAALALSRARPVRPGERWLDLCAGPGGKAALLTAEARLGGADVLANELVPARAELVRRALAVFDPAPETVVGDATRFAATHPGAFDRILLDAPCTGLGALRRRPEARWRKQPGDVASLAALQRELLAAALTAVAPGGIVAYVTCSPHLAETRGVLDAVLDGRHDVERVDTWEVLDRVMPEPAARGEGLSAQLWPQELGTDAMFIGLLRRRA